MRTTRTLSIVLFGFAALAARRAEAQQVTVLIDQTMMAVPANGTINCGGPKIGGSTMTAIDLKNTGGAQLSISNITMGGPQAAEFQISQFAPPVKLAPNTPLPMTITFAPLMMGTRTATMTIASNDQNNPNFTVNLVGTSGDPSISLDTGTAAFGNQRVNVPSMPQAINITNSGFGDLMITSIGTTGQAAKDFTVTDAKGNPIMPFTVKPMTSTPFNVTFTPSALGNRSAQIVVSSSDPNNPTRFVNVLGTGTMAMLSVMTPMGCPNCKLDFGDANIYAPSMPKTIVLQNAGNDAANVKSITFGKGQMSNFSLSLPPPLPAKIPAAVNGMNGTLSINVVALPLTLGAVMDSVTITTDDPNPGNATFTVPLTANGVGGSITATPNFADFGTWPTGKTSDPISIMLTNTGTADLNVMTMALAGNNPDVFTITPDPMAFMPTPLMPGMSLPLTITFSPVVAMTHSAQLVITTDDPKAKTLQIPLDGVGGTGPQVAFNPPSLDFGLVAVGATAGPTAITITNAGGSPLQINSLTLGGASPQAFAIDLMGPFTIQSMQSQKVMATFTPLTPGSQSATISLAIQGMMAPATYMLRGSGQAPMLGVAPQALDFGPVKVGATSASQTVNIKNGGSQPVVIATIKSTDAQFLVDTSATMFTLASQAQTSFAVTFTPSAAAPAMATINVNVMGGVGAALSIGAKGTGVSSGGGGGGGGGGRGGGGCSAAPAPVRTAWPLALFALAGLVVLRRRFRS